MAESSRLYNNGILYVDETYFSVLFDDEEIFPISDERYADELQLQEALISATISYPRFRTTTLNNNRTVQIKQEEVHQEAIKGSGKGKEIMGAIARTSQGFCTICMDPKPREEMFRSSSCSHSFCVECMGTYISTRIRDNIFDLNCPDPNCRVKLDPNNCRGVVPKEVFDRWEDAMCEAMILASEKFYCPYKDCSSLLIDEGDRDNHVVIESESPNCHRLFCAQCKVPWHGGYSCEEFKSGGNSMKFDKMMVQLAQTKKWKQCQKCKFYVEKSDGCDHISCRCGNHFCYQCGGNWRDGNHICRG